ILNCYNRLICKGLQQVNSGFCELARCLASDHERANDVVWTEHGNNQNAAIAFCNDDLADRGGRFVSDVGDLDWLALNSGRSDVRVTEADTQIGDGCDHYLAHAVGSM